MSNKNSTLLSSTWVITLTATLIGVFLALYLNEWMASKKLKDQKLIATENILAEISSNQKNLEKCILQHNELLASMTFLTNHTINDDLVVPVDSMIKFRSKYPTFITIEDSTLLSKGIYIYRGELNLNVSTPHMQLMAIAWETLKNSGFSTTYGFECLMYLESIDKLTNELLQKDKELLEYLTGIRDSGKKNELLFSHLNLLIDYEESLLGIYQLSEEKLSDCG